MRYATQSRRFIQPFHCVTSFSKEIKIESDIFVDAKMKCQVDACVNFFDAHYLCIHLFTVVFMLKRRKKRSKMLVTKQSQLSEHYSLLRREKVEISHKAATMLKKEECTFDAAT